MEPIQTEQINGYTVEIYVDKSPESPRDWDNLGTMVCFHRRYELGDKHCLDIEEAKAFAVRKDIIALPLYLYDHSGLSMSTSNASYPFDCPWDSGQVGYIFVKRDTILKEYGGKRLTKARRLRIEKILRMEVDTYSQYLSGQVYGYVIKEKDGTEYSSCWGFVGDIDYCRMEAFSVINP